MSYEHLLPQGLRWTGPQLKSGGSDNCVWLDLNAANPAERLKFMTCWLHVPKEQRPQGFMHSLHVSDGKTWSDVEILASRPNQGCWAPSMFVHKNKAHLFWFTKSTGFRDMTNRLMSTGADGRTFGDDREILQGWQAENRQAAIDAIDVRHGTHLLDGRVLFPIAWQEPLDKSDPWWPPREADLRMTKG